MMAEGSGYLEISQLHTVLVVEASLRGEFTARDQLWDSPSASVPSQHDLP